jgi:hypothetical protein
MRVAKYEKLTTFWIAACLSVIYLCVLAGWRPGRTAVRSATGRSEGLENTDLGTYSLISKWGFPKTYRGKLMLVAFLGTHAPLLSAALFLLPLFTRVVEYVFVEVHIQDPA